MARGSDNVVSPLQKRANDTGTDALGSAGDNDSLVCNCDSTLLSLAFSFGLGWFRPSAGIGQVEARVPAQESDVGTGVML
jgi:hypothetical protein